VLVLHLKGLLYALSLLGTCSGPSRINNEWERPPPLIYIEIKLRTLRIISHINYTIEVTNICENEIKR